MSSTGIIVHATFPSQPTACRSTTSSRSRRRPAVVPYLARLGVGACYTSPYFTAAAGSTHGYDVFNHNEINPELGGAAAHQAFVSAVADARSRPHRRLRAESHGHQRRRERVVARRARERPELADGKVLRHRLGAGQDRAAREAAAPDPRRSVRTGAGARRAAARVPRRQLSSCSISSTSCR